MSAAGEQKHKTSSWAGRRRGAPSRTRRSRSAGPHSHKSRAACNACPACHPASRLMFIPSHPTNSNTYASNTYATTLLRLSHCWHAARCCCPCWPVSSNFVQFHRHRIRSALCHRPHSDVAEHPNRPTRTRACARECGPCALQALRRRIRLPSRRRDAATSAAVLALVRERDCPL